MPQICMYLQLHQPDRLREVSVFEVGALKTADGKNYFDAWGDNLNKLVFEKVSEKSYLPMLGLLVRLTKELPKFRCALSTSGVFLDQAERYQPEVIKLLRELLQSGSVELLAETYFHSLAGLYSENEFRDQVAMHEQRVIDLFSIKPKVFRNTELIYSNYIGWQVAELGYDALLTEAVPRYLGDRAKTQLFRSHTHNPIPLLLKHADFSDDVAFRFSNKQWPGHPLTAEKYLHWVEMYGEHELINLFMDFETFGEHQWADTGIFDFVHSFFHQFLARSWNQCVTPSDVVEQLALDTAAISDLPVYDVPDPISWADVDRDLTAWRDNSMQHDALRLIYSLEQQVKATNDLGIIDDWRRLQTSDHFYYMCTKWAADGDVHAYFSPFDSPYEAYRRFAIALADLQERLIPS